MDPYLFRFSKKNSGPARRGKQLSRGLGSDTSAPLLVNDTGRVPDESISTPQLIDVVSKFDWTHTAGAYRNEVPYNN